MNGSTTKTAPPSALLHRLASNHERRTRDEIAKLKAALKQIIYEATHLSSAEEDGSHWCRISAGTLLAAREAVSGK